MKKDIKITSKLIKKLVSGEKIEIDNEIFDDAVYEILKNIVYAEIINGNYEKSISINLHKEAYDKSSGETEIYETEELYRLPYSKNKKWLRISLRNAQKQWCTSYMND